ncbi:MAG: electron transport complex subunit RsxG [Pseudomonadota bacterium]|jgi:electron transport complex protein RnfG
MNASPEASIVRVSARTGAILFVFAFVFTALMGATYYATREPIAASEEKEKLKLINEVLPPQDYDNRLLADQVEIAPAAELGVASSRVFRARKNGAPAALVVEAAAPDGYSGRIGLILAIDASGRVSGVRVTQHKETPGLGDYIDPAKDKNKASPWIRQFDGKGLAEVPAAQWKVKKDGGRFDQRAGATISARAVTRAVGRALLFVNAHRDVLFAAPQGARLDPSNSNPESKP